MLIGAGEPIGIPGRGDITYPFRAHSEYYYLTDRNRPGAVLAFDPGEGWSHFQAQVTESERLWEGAPETEPDGPSTSELQGWLGVRSARSVACLGVPVPGVVCDEVLSERLRVELTQIRRRKDAVELARMRAAAAATHAAFAAAEASLRVGATEREVQIELEAAAFRAGAERMAFDTIVGSGPNSAVLHSEPGSRRLRPGDLVLIDAGAEHRGYASDVTRAYLVGAEPTPEQREIYAIVQAAQSAAVERCQPGVEWRDVHLTAGRVIAEGLVSLGLLRGQPDSLVESGAVWLFFPHGIGHLVGLGVRDAGGTRSRRKDTSRAIPNLRIDLALEPGMVVTVEPGLYFVPAVLGDSDRRASHRQEVAWDRVDGMLDFGGIRLEDNALINEHGHEILTREIPLARFDGQAPPATWPAPEPSSDARD